MTEQEIRATLRNVDEAVVAERNHGFRARAFAALVGGSVLAATIGLAACGGSKPAKSPGEGTEGVGTEGAGGTATTTTTPPRDYGPHPPYMAPDG